MSPHVSQSAGSTSSKGAKRGHLFLFVKDSGAHAVAHVRNGPETTELGDESQSVYGRDRPGLLVLPDLFL